MKAQQAFPFCCRFANNRIFPNSPESVSTLWRYDWCKKHMSLCHGRQQHGRLRNTLMRSQWLSRWILQREPAQPEMPHSRQDFVVHSCIEVCFFPVETVTPTLTSDGAQKKTLAFCCCALRCIGDSNELVCSKMEKEGSRSHETLQVEKVAVVAIWRCDRIAMVVWNLIRPALKPHDIVVLPHHLKSITRQFNLQIIPRLCCTFCSFLLHCWQIICWTKNKQQRRSHYFQKIGEYYCDVASQCGWIYWRLILRDVVYNAANVCEPHFVTGKQCAWWKILWRHSGKRYPHRSFAEL